MPLSLNEIRSRALAFSLKWASESSEDSEAKSFWDGFFEVFGIARRKWARFELAVKKLDGATGYIDLLWEGVLAVEHKSRGKNLDRAFQQAVDYLHGLTDKQQPRYVLVSDFAQFRLYDLENLSSGFVGFALEHFHQHIEHFGFIAGYQKREYREQDQVNSQAAEKMGELHDRLEQIGYRGEDLELYLVRLLFCLFADTSSIFERGSFADYITDRTSEDGSDLAGRLDELFQVLNKPAHLRYTNLDESLVAFPYVNGQLFERRLPTASFDSGMRRLLLDSLELDWAQISPAIFGSLFQSVMNPLERRSLGAHYTSEQNILKLVKPLFLDQLWADRTLARNQRPRLEGLLERISRLRFIDPACGCGNFLIVAYRELRLLELDILKELYPPRDTELLDIDSIMHINVDQFYGIEYDGFPAEIARVAMWLIDHQMNALVSQVFGRYYVRLPLSKAANIVHGNALRKNWSDELNLASDAARLSGLHILGNPPFRGKTFQTAEQREDLHTAFHDAPGVGDLDFVTAWFIKAAELMKALNASHPKLPTNAAFVSTNSITHGEQVSLLWTQLNQTGVQIQFAHRSFKWRNEGRKNAAVYCVIIGFGLEERKPKLIFDYHHSDGQPYAIEVPFITPYLVGYKHMILVYKAQAPLTNVARMGCGSKPSDDGHLILENEAVRDAFVKLEPTSAPFIKRYIGTEQLLYDKPRFCLWLKDVQPHVLRELPLVKERLARVRAFRAVSTALPTRRAADTPARFFFDAQPQTRYIAVPEVSSAQRKYIPIAFLDPEVIASNKLYIIAEPSLFLFGMLTSDMYMTWVRHISGRMKIDFQYSATMVYNTFPFPRNVKAVQRQRVETAAAKILEVRARYPSSSLADLYDPNTMPADLLESHQTLDRAVEACYGKKQFKIEHDRMSYLFDLYDQLTNGFLSDKEMKKSKRKRATRTAAD